ncbi:pentapeptide repeat-containing protein [Rothia dentocariosa]|uniref:pentapeptide repeat-containing protein n=1 Tax=Rothia dentocariosa TaxID=2047 RepID=UPI00195B8516|nr:pentapeptide repeat-containing protein [Rothia dentocariosa]VTY06974.1 Pentapeptide repeats (9 copies) [Rothia dentocariosa]
MPKEREDIETKSSGSPEVYQQTKFMAWFEKAFPWLLVGGAALGLVLMIFLPVIFFQEKTAEQLLAQSNLRLALLYTTGGAIAALGLLETYRKNTNDRTKANADINAALKNQEHQTKVLKEQIRQFDDNAFKERKAERRERYTKAVEQLGDEKAPIRMGGVYTLVGLVDEWLEEKSLSDDERFKEGQVIINNLCAYIRSPFTLASHYDELSNPTPTPEGIYKDKKEKFYADKATLDSETDVRLSIIKEIHDRLQGPDKNTPGAWSDFEYDFSGSTFFYPIDLTKSYYKKPVNFSGATYQGWAYFTGSTYQGGANFTDSTYQGWANFRGSTYQAWANFTDSTYKSEANFSDSTYQGGADFSGSTYQGEAYFSGSTYQGGANFSGSTYQALADFSSSTYKSGANFNSSTYKSGANFNSSTYGGDADFSRSIFYSKTYFGKDKYSNSSSCFTNRAPQFYDKTNHKNTLFGSHNNDFTVDIDKGYPINLNSEGLPLGCKILTSEQKEYLEYKFQEIEKIQNELFEVKDPKEKEELLKKLQALNKELYEWRGEATTVKVEGTAPEEKNN